jgi:hypothetical protein
MLLLSCAAPDQRLSQLLWRRQRREHEFTVNGDRWQREHSEFDGVIELVTPLEVVNC